MKMFFFVILNRTYIFKKQILADPFPHRAPLSCERGWKNQDRQEKGPVLQARLALEHLWGAVIREKQDETPAVLSHHRNEEAAQPDEPQAMVSGWSSIRLVS